MVLADHIYYGRDVLTVDSQQKLTVTVVREYVRHTVHIYTYVYWTGDHMRSG